jgi:multidrug efflux pump
MNISTPFIHRPVGTALLTVAVALAGILAYFFLPVSPLPQMEFPTVSVSAGLPGASPETMASSVATPLERQFGRIAGVTEMTSTSTLGSTSITLQFDLSRNIDAAARDVQAAINAATGQLPANLPSRPTYKKVNPSDAPVLILSLTSDIYDKARMYDVASSILAQKLSQVQGVGQVTVGGGALPAVRAEVNPTLLNGTGLALADIRSMLGTANANRPKGEIAGPAQTYSLATTDQLLKAKQYEPLIITYRNGAAVRLSDVATVTDSVENIRAGGIFNGKPAIMMIIFRQPGANIIETVDNVIHLIPLMQAQIPAGIKMAVALDRTTTIRASVHDVEVTLLLSIGLVIFVVFIFLRNGRATLIPSVAVPISLLGTFGVMYLLGYSIDNLSLMALTISTGFVVDDAIVVIENISRHIEAGMKPMAAALQGAQEIGFTVLSISLSLVAVFIPILLMGGVVGRLLREFAVTLSVAIGVSLVVSLTTTPMMCAYLLRGKDELRHGRLYMASERVFDWILGFYRVTLSWVLRNQFRMIFVTLATMAATVGLYVIVPKDFFPQQDTGRLQGAIKSDQATSYQAMSDTLQRFTSAVSKDPAVENVVGFTGGGTLNQANMFVTLKSNAGRGNTGNDVLLRLKKELARVPGGTLNLNLAQELRIGGRQSNLQYQYTLQGDDLSELNLWAPRMQAKMSTLKGFTQTDSDQQNHGLQASLIIDRPTAARLGLAAADIDNALYDAFGQRQVSTMYTALNQYHVVMEVNPQFWQSPDALRYIYVRSSTGAQVPLSSFTHYETTTAPLAVNHSGRFPSITVSFNLAPGVSLGEAVTEIQDGAREIGLPASIHGKFAGTAQAYQDSLSNEPILLAAALATVYIVLGMLYESLIHPITILSTLPSAGVGALLAIIVCHPFFGTNLDVIAIIGIILLIGIVKKNAIMMIDFALDAERNGGKTPDEAIFQACMLRFRPIMMTTMAALLGGLPLALGTGTGSELRRPLGITIVGGLVFSQMLTLYTTPVVYLYLDRFRLWVNGRPDHPLLAAPAI